MARQNINIGTSANKGDGEPLRTAFDKINDNFTEVYGDIQALKSGAIVADVKGTIVGDDSTILVDAVNSTIPATNLSGALPALDGSALTNVSVSSIDFTNVTNTPTTLAGYGITDAASIDGSNRLKISDGGLGIVEAANFIGHADETMYLSSKTTGAESTHIALNSTSGVSTIMYGAVDFANGGSVDFTGSTVTGLTTGITDVVSDITPQLGGNLDLNSNNITGTGNINITGTLTLGGNSISGVDNIAAGTLNNHTIPGGSAGTLALIGDVVVTETDPVVGAVNGIVKADGAGNISAAVAGTDYLVVETIDLATLKGEVAASADFADFKTRIAAL